MESALSGVAPLEIRLFGPVSIWKDGGRRELPPSRKVRALLAYLALAPHPVARAHLCEIFWDVPNDPRGELRWTLSKLRAILDESTRSRVITKSGAVSLDLADAWIDAVAVARAVEDLDTLPLPRVCALADAAGEGEFLSGLEIEGSPAFNGWLAAQRRTFHAHLATLLEYAVERCPPDDGFTYLERWVDLEPHNMRPQTLLLQGLADRNRFRDGDAHVAAMVPLFERAGMDPELLHAVWRTVRATPGSPRVGPVAVRERRATVETEDPVRRASIAVMPFADLSPFAPAQGSIADGLAHDVITRLAKLRSLFVIAQGSVFALRDRNVSADEAARALQVDYVATGSVLRRDGHLSVTVELTDTRSGHIVWAEIFKYPHDETFGVLETIGDRIVASIAGEIEAAERNRAILRPPNSLDAWEAYHRGLWHMYRFSSAENELAKHFFSMAVQRDPTFARAYAGLSFTHFQDAFQGWADRRPAIELAQATAGQSVMADERDPAAHLAAGRALWLQGRFEQSLDELEQSVELSPNFALGHYTLAFVHSQAGDPLAAIASSDYSQQLSPYDPLLFGMFGARAMALTRLGRFDEAAGYGVKAAARPNAHAHIFAIAAYTLALNGQLADARRHLDAIHRLLPTYDVEDFLTAMHFGPADAELFRTAEKTLTRA